MYFCQTGENVGANWVEVKDLYGHQLIQTPIWNTCTSVFTSSHCVIQCVYDTSCVAVQYSQTQKCCLAFGSNNTATLLTVSDLKYFHLCGGGKLIGIFFIRNIHKNDNFQKF